MRALTGAAVRSYPVLAQMGRPRRIQDFEIAREAKVVFLADGPAASTQKIARRLGVSQAALFKRVPTKAQLLLLALGPCPTPSLLERLPAGPDADRAIPGQLAAVAAELLAFFRELMPGLVTLRASGVRLDHAFPPGTTFAPMQLRQDLAIWFRLAQQQRRLRATETRPMVEMLLGALESRAMLEHLLGHTPTAAEDELFSSGLVHAAWRAIAPEA